MSDKRRGLGRGLSALLPEAPAEGPRTLPVARLRPSRLQPRSDFDESGLDELAESIRAQGVIQPIIVSVDSKDGYTIIAGERRWRAAQRAGLAEVPVVVREVRDDRHLLELALVENVQRADLNPIEEAEAYRQLADGFGLSHEEVAGRVGRRRATVSNALRLLRLPAEVQDLLRSGRLTAGQAKPLLALDDTDEIVRLATRAAEKGLSARALEEIAGRKGGGKRKAKPEPEPNTAAAAEKLTRRLQTRVEIARSGRGGTIRIHFGSEEELIRLFELLAGDPRRQR